MPSIKAVIPGTAVILVILLFGSLMSCIPRLPLLVFPANHPCLGFSLVSSTVLNALSSGNVLGLLKSFSYFIFPSGLLILSLHAIIVIYVGFLFERTAGSLRFIMAFALGGLTGAITHVVLFPQSQAVILGSAGGVAALLGVGFGIAKKSDLVYTAIILFVVLENIGIYFWSSYRIMGIFHLSVFEEYWRYLRSAAPQLTSLDSLSVLLSFLAGLLISSFQVRQGKETVCPPPR